MSEQRRKIIFIIILAILIVVGSFYSFCQKNSVSENTTSGEVLAKSAKEREEKVSEIIVYISGAINRPGVFKLGNNARIIDVVTLAGGLTAEADVTKINMAQVLKDGMHINVLTRAVASSSEGELSSGQSKTAGRASANSGAKVQELVNINTADKNALDTLPGIGPALAERIVEYRQNNGSFSDIEELRKVPGVGASKFEKLKAKITI